MDGCCCCCTRRLQPPRPIRKRKADDVNYVLWPRFSKKIDLNPLYSFFFYFLFVFSLSSSLCLQLCCVLILAKNAAFRSRKWKNIGKGRLSSSSFFFCRMSQKSHFHCWNHNGIIYNNYCICIYWGWINIEYLVFISWECDGILGTWSIY